MADEDWTVPKKVGTEYTDPYQRDHDKLTVTRGYVMWILREAARLGRMVQVVELENIALKAEVERLTAIVGADAIDREHGMCCDASAQVERLTKAVMHSPAAQLKLKELEGKTTFGEINPDSK